MPSKRKSAKPPETPIETVRHRDKRAKRLGARSDLRQRDDGLRGRAVGAAVDHDRHQPRGADLGPHAIDGRPIPVLLLSDTPEGIEKEANITGQLPPHPLPKTEGDIRRGFVYKRVPHITLKVIANNEEIDTIHARWEERSSRC